MSAKKRGRKPQRTCCICRKKGLKESLFRFVCQSGVIIFDEEQKLPGRGAYCCCKECIQLLLASRKKWKRLFRLE